MHRIFYILILLLCVGTAGAATHWYVDAGAGGANNGTSTTDAWTSAESAFEKADYDLSGNTAHIRRTHQEAMSSDWVVVDDGAITAIIHILGDDGSVPAWSGDTAGIASFSTSTWNIKFGSADNYWTLENLRFEDGDENCIEYTSSNGHRIKNCEFTEFAAGVNYGISCVGADLIVEGCAFDGNRLGMSGADLGYGMTIANGAVVYINNCTFDDMTLAISPTNGGVPRISNSSFGQTETNTFDVDFQGGCTVSMVDCTLNDNTKIDGHSTNFKTVAQLNRSYRNVDLDPMQFTFTEAHQTLTDYDTIRGGGAPHSIAVTTPSANFLGDNARASIVNYSIHADSAETRAYAIWARRDADWNVAPADSQLYLEVVYSDGSRDSSTAVLTNADTWYELTVSATPDSDGPVMLTLWLQVTDANGTIYVDPLLTATGETFGTPTYHWGQPIARLIQPVTVGGQVWIVTGG